MAWDNPRFSFPQAEQYAFLFENAHLLLLSWQRDMAKFIFLIKEHRESGLVLDYPGEEFTNRVLDTIQNIFFVQVQEEDADPQRYVLGSFFVHEGKSYGAYYQRDAQEPMVVFFEIRGEAPDFVLEILSDADYKKISAVFANDHEDLMEIEQANRPSNV